MPLRESISTPLTVLSILANAALILAWFVSLHLWLYAGAENAVLTIPYYLFGLVMCIPVSVANEFLVVQPAVSILRGRSRPKRAAITLLAAAALSGVGYGALRAVIAIAGGPQNTPEAISIIAAWTAFIALLLFQIVLAFALPCMLISIIRVVVAKTATPTPNRLTPAHGIKKVARVK